MAEIAKPLNIKLHPYHETMGKKDIHHYSVNSKVYDNVLCLPAITHIFPQASSEYCVYDKNYLPIHSAHIQRTVEGGKLEFRENNLLKNKKDLLSSSVFVEKKSIYLGYLFNSYGHFISESISRAWAFVLNNTGNINEYLFVFNSIGNAITKDILVSYKFHEHLSLLGIELDNILIIDAPVVFKTLLIPEQSIMFRDAGSKVQSLVWDKISNTAAKKNNKKYPDKIYFSRRNVNNPTAGRVINNEDEIENVFRKYGFEIISPHDLESEIVKLNYLSNANYLASLCGSGLHNSAFLKSGATVIQLANIFKTMGVPFQHLIDYLKGNKLLNFYSNIKSENDQLFINVDELDFCLGKKLF